jgi:hypothetical protein
VHRLFRRRLFLRRRLLRHCRGEREQ